METKTETLKPIGQPLHNVCEENVTKPKLILKDINGVKVWLQWFGTSKNFDLQNKQFLFPINTSPSNFYLHPEKFELIMIGPVKNWPNKDVVDDLIEQLGGEDVNIVYFISPEIGTDDGNGQTVPAAGILPLDIKLADDNCGIIDPEEYFDDSVRIRAIEKIQSKE